MASFAIAQNLKKIKTRQYWTNVVEGAAAPILYSGVPTAMNQNGIAGVAWGAGACAAVGTALDMPGTTAGGIAIALQHIMYTEFNDQIKEIFGRPIFRYDESNRAFRPNANPGTGIPTAGLAGGIQPGAKIIDMGGGNGTAVTYARPEDQAMADYYTASEAQALSGYHEDPNQTALSECPTYTMMDAFSGGTAHGGRPFG